MEVAESLIAVEFENVNGFSATGGADDIPDLSNSMLSILIGRTSESDHIGLRGAIDEHEHGIKY